MYYSFTKLNKSREKKKTLFFCLNGEKTRPAEIRAKDLNIMKLINPEDRSHCFLE